MSNIYLLPCDKYVKKMYINDSMYNPNTVISVWINLFLENVRAKTWLLTYYTPFDSQVQQPTISRFVFSSQVHAESEDDNIK